jgi:hypothetical protein
MTGTGTIFAVNTAYGIEFIQAAFSFFLGNIHIKYAAAAHGFADFAGRVAAAVKIDPPVMRIECESGKLFHLFMAPFALKLRSSAHLRYYYNRYDEVFKRIDGGERGSELE